MLRSPVPFGSGDDAPALQPGGHYDWELRLADAATTSGSFSLSKDANSQPGVAGDAPAAIAAAQAAGDAGRPADGIMQLSILPEELRADDALRALRAKLIKAVLNSKSPPDDEK